MSDVLSEDPEIEIVGTAQDGKEAVEKYRDLKPDAVILDVEMPVMNGIDALKEMRQIDASQVMIMFSALTERGAAITLHSLTNGANDFVTKPGNTGDFFVNREALKRELIPKIKLYCGRLDSQAVQSVGQPGNYQPVRPAVILNPSSRPCGCEQPPKS